LQTSPAFVQLRVSDETSVVVVDLIAEAADSIEPPGSTPRAPSSRKSSARCSNARSWAI
jgi:hypothetical protein